MTSIQCHKRATTCCEQKCYCNNSSDLNQKVAEIVSRITAKLQTTTEVRKCYPSTTGFCHAYPAKRTAQTHCFDTASCRCHQAKCSGVEAACLLKKVKGGQSGNRSFCDSSSCSDCSSCSDSDSDCDSDDEGCYRRECVCRTKGAAGIRMQNRNIRVVGMN